MMKIVLMVLAAVAGVAGACQAAANAALTSRAGIGTALLINTVLVLGGVCVVFVATGSPRTFRAAAGAPLHHYLGGLGGFMVIATLAFAVPRVGTAVTIALLVLGQGTMALIIDQFGLWGMRVVPISATRLLGVACLILGVALMRR